MASSAELELTRPHDNQRMIIDSPARFRVAACGRRFGKTEVGKHEILHAALYGKTCWWLAPTYTMASQVWRDLKWLLRPIPGWNVNESERYIELPTGGYIAVRSTHDYQNLRGAGLDFAVLDEAAFMHPDVWPQVVRPMLLTTRGGALFLSSPFGRNHFWRLYGLGLDPLEGEWESFHFTSYDNPIVQHEEVENIERNTPQRIFREEYLAEFIDAEGAVFRRVHECATASLEAEPVEGHRYIAGVDWARENDYTVIAVIDADEKQLVYLERFHQIGWSLQRGRVTAMHQRWKPSVIWAEANSIGSVNIEALQSEGLPVRDFMTTAKSKAPLIEGLALAFERGDIRIPPDRVLIDELLSYQVERLANGFRYSAPPGGHDDTVIALALAWQGAVHSTVGEATYLDIEW